MEIVKLSVENYLLFSPYLNPNHFQRFEDGDDLFWGFGLVEGHVPYGVLLAELSSTNSVSITHFEVAQDAQSTTYLERLLDHTERQINQNDLVITNMTVNSPIESSSVEELFRKKGWSQESQVINQYIVDFKLMQRSEWVWSLKKPENIAIQTWDDEVEQAFKRAVHIEEKFDDFVLPLVSNLGVIDDQYSFVLTVDGEIMGWCFCERVAKNMLLSPMSYVKRTPATRLGAMLLYSELVKKALETDMYVTFFANVDNLYMQNIINRRFKECIIQKKPIMHLFKSK
ncbi:hypothetical protein JTI58_12110 [Lysinibacillus fusiformis]|uniref:hypothetical protein n=1 Tax=Lysinibacillus fusiformis TaxID=28031 RepID=UPI001966E727|nr:hypothetical protein [Lysinibacillus fusiformis]QSB12301.1 hypothetical protein JTI58_12110 [Lysinibacillus fusiformis]